jgi:hypothetical protein
MRNASRPLVTLTCTGSALAQTDAPVGTYTVKEAEKVVRAPGYLAWEALASTPSSR